MGIQRNFTATLKADVGRLRATLRRHKKELPQLEAILQLALEKKGSHRVALRQDVKMCEWRIGEAERDIERAERVIYGEYAPKRPPSPERSEEIRKAK